MNDCLINNLNEVVGPKDTVIHAGDFTLSSSGLAHRIITQLTGTHIFLQGSHDYWNKGCQHIWERKIEGQYIVICHYAMRTWARSHYNSWQLFGHSHGTLEPVGKQWDIGVDNNNFSPVSFEQIKKIMAERPDNPNQATDRQ